MLPKGHLLDDYVACGMAAVAEGTFDLKCASVLLTAVLLASVLLTSDPPLIPQQLLF